LRVSLVLETVALASTGMNTPGEWVMGWLAARANQRGESYDLRTIIILPIVLDASIIFVVLWDAYSTCMEIRDRGR
jgi:hypothetical protein